MRRLWCIGLCCLGCGSLEPPPPLATSFASLTSVEAAPAAAPLEILCFDIGQGDATLVTLPDGTSWLIDGGPPGSGDTIRTWLERAGHWPPDFTVATHYDLDHIGGLVELMRGPDAVPGTADDMRPRRACLDRGPPAVPPATAHLSQYLTLRTTCQTPGAGTDVGTDLVRIDILAINGTFADHSTIPVATDDENAHSLVLRIRYQDFSYLHMADLPGGGGTPPYQTIDLESAVARLAGPIDVLHVGHHGSKTSTNATLLALTHPQAAIISVGAPNDYGHPHRDVLERLHAAGTAVYTTTDGHHRLTSNGSTFDIQLASE